MTTNPPPAPDWVLGDDGHWKPPPFDGGGRRPTATAPPPVAGHPGAGAPPPAAPWAGPPGGPPPMPPSKGNGTVIAIVAGVVAVVVLVPVVLILAVTLLGREAEPKFQAVGSAIDTGDGALVPIDPGPTTEPAPASAELAEWCPSGAEVAATLGDVSGPEAAAQPPTVLDMNGVPLDAELCYYGGTIDIGRIATSDPDAVLADLALSTGRYTAGDGGLDVSSVRLVLPGGESGAVRLVFLHGDELLTVALNGADDGRADALAQMLLARPPG